MSMHYNIEYNFSLMFLYHMIDYLFMVRNHIVIIRLGYMHIQLHTVCSHYVIEAVTFVFSIKAFLEFISV